MFQTAAQELKTDNIEVAIAAQDIFDALDRGAAGIYSVYSGRQMRKQQLLR